MTHFPRLFKPLLNLHLVDSCRSHHRFFFLPLLSRDDPEREEKREGEINRNFQRGSENESLEASTSIPRPRPLSFSPSLLPLPFSIHTTTFTTHSASANSSWIHSHASSITRRTVHEEWNERTIHHYPPLSGASISFTYTRIFHSRQRDLLHVHPAYVYFAIDPALVARRTPHFSRPTRELVSSQSPPCTALATAVTPAREVTGTCVVGCVRCVVHGDGKSVAWAPTAEGGTTLSTAPGLILAWLRGERSVGTVGRSVGRRRWCDAPGTTPTPRAVSARRRPSSTRKRKRGAMLDGRGWTRTNRAARRWRGREREREEGGIGDVWERDCSRLEKLPLDGAVGISNDREDRFLSFFLRGLWLLLPGHWLSLFSWGMNAMTMGLFRALPRARGGS